MTDNILICGQMTQEIGPLAKWPGAAPTIPWFLDTSGYKGQFSADVIRKAYATAWKAWADVFEITTPEATSNAEALVRAHFARIDGQYSVLAWSELANNTNQPKTQRYDNTEPWTLEWEPGNGIPLITVAIHEIGHVLGLDHDSSNANAIMRPSVSRSLPRPTERDFQRLAGLGYKRRTTPPPTPVPDPPPVNGLQLPLPGGGLLKVDYPTKVITYPSGWTGRLE
jgi:hypothetical protein